MAEEHQAVDIDVVVRLITRVIDTPTALRTLVFSLVGEQQPRAQSLQEEDVLAMLQALQRNSSIVYLCLAGTFCTCVFVCVLMCACVYVCMYDYPIAVAY